MGILAQRQRYVPSAKPLLVCLSHLRWGFVFQRPQHLLCRAAQVYDVIFIEEPQRLADAQPALMVERPSDDITVLTPQLPEGMTAAQEEAAQRSLLDGYFESRTRAIDLLWYYTPMALGFSRHWDADVVVYDNMDELSAFRGAPPELLAREAELLTRADLLFTGGYSLYEAKRSRHPQVVPFPSSVDVPHFARARTAQHDPADQCRLAHPRIGFFGVIDERMDLALVDAVAALRQDWQFIMLGPVVKIDAGSLPCRENLHWLGQKSYAELPAYMAHWDAGFMPFALNEATRFISPTKTPEFLAAGLPLVSTPIRDVVRPYGEQALVEIAEGPQATVAALDRLLEGPGDLWSHKVQQHLATMSWDKTWAGMLYRIAGIAKRRLIAGASARDAAHV